MKTKAILFIFLLLLSISQVIADVINPSLIEITIHNDNSIELNIRANIEAILSDSNLYKNSKNSPNVKKYDTLRAMHAIDIENIFLQYLTKFLDNISIKFDNNKTKLNLISITTPDIGYQGRERVSLIKFSAKLNNMPKTMLWNYHSNYGDNAYRYRFYQKNEYTWQDWHWLKNNNNSGLIKLKTPKKFTNSQILMQYINIGYYHILPKGLDHILFIIGIAILGLPWRKLLMMITIFTIAHSITLSLSIYNIVKLPIQIVESLIALSIAYIGIEVLLNRVKYNFQAIVIFLFGLLHGLGFAFILENFNMQQNTFLLSLAGFNIGIELGQISIILAVLLTIYLVKKITTNHKKYLIRPAAIFITVTGLLWVIEIFLL